MIGRLADILSSAIIRPRGTSGGRDAPTFGVPYNLGGGRRCPAHQALLPHRRRPRVKLHLLPYKAVTPLSLPSLWPFTRYRVSPRPGHPSRAPRSTNPRDFKAQSLRPQARFPGVPSPPHWSISEASLQAPRGTPAPTKRRLVPDLARPGEPPTHETGWQRGDRPQTRLKRDRSSSAASPGQNKGGPPPVSHDVRLALLRCI